MMRTMERCQVVGKSAQEHCCLTEDGVTMYMKSFQKKLSWENVSPISVLVRYSFEPLSRFAIFWRQRGWECVLHVLGNNREGKCV